MPVWEAPRAKPSATSAPGRLTGRPGRARRTVSDPQEVRAWWTVDTDAGPGRSRLHRRGTPRGLHRPWPPHRRLRGTGLSAGDATTGRLVRAPGRTNATARGRAVGFPFARSCRSGGGTREGLQPPLGGVKVDLDTANSSRRHVGSAQDKSKEVNACSIPRFKADYLARSGLSPTAALWQAAADGRQFITCGQCPVPRWRRHQTGKGRTSHKPHRTPPRSRPTHRARNARGAGMRPNIGGV